jgi:hypothetical protein
LRLGNSWPGVVIFINGGLRSKPRATAMMYLRILAIIAVFNWSLAASLTPSLLALSLLGFALAGLHDLCAGRPVGGDIGESNATHQPTRAHSRDTIRNFEKPRPDRAARGTPPGLSV